MGGGARPGERGIAAAGESVETSGPSTSAAAIPALAAPTDGLPRPAATAVRSPRSFTTVTTATLSEDIPRARTPWPLRRGSRGMASRALSRPPESDSLRYGSSACADTPSPCRMGWSCERIASRTRMRMNQLVLRHAPQRAAGDLGLSPAAMPST
ncbi:hypothetical protein [Collinsella ihumii]|uniref:Uncharacterized protein n=1 Tax=Collinsella ihumii TaxID=1720204 RepID=A0ABT7XF26_9ACTN|nr:hypothetical protein [Collinsella ihumii]MDN0063998.1 hypothetical protein [Collinsella ihumii]